MGLIFQGMCLKLKRAGSKTSKKLAEGGTVIVGSELPPECVWFFVLVCFFLRGWNSSKINIWAVFLSRT